MKEIKLGTLKKICKLLNVKYAVATTSGTVALFLALKPLVLELEMR